MRGPLIYRLWILFWLLRLKTIHNELLTKSIFGPLHYVSISYPYNPELTSEVLASIYPFNVRWSWTTWTLILSYDEAPVYRLRSSIIYYLIRLLLQDKLFDTSKSLRRKSVCISGPTKHTMCRLWIEWLRFSSTYLLSREDKLNRSIFSPHLIFFYIKQLIKQLSTTSRAK